MTEASQLSAPAHLTKTHVSIVFSTLFVPYIEADIDGIIVALFPIQAHIMALERRQHDVIFCIENQAVPGQDCSVAATRANSMVSVRVTSQSGLSSSKKMAVQSALAALMTNMKAQGQ